MKRGLFLRKTYETVWNRHGTHSILKIPWTDFSISLFDFLNTRNYYLMAPFAPF
jgi:hypothetical protein